MSDRLSQLSVYMPLLLDDFRYKDALLSAEQHMACLRLTAHFWLTQKPLPDDDSALAVIARAGSDWQDMRPAVLLLFFQQTREGWVPVHYRQALQDAVARAKRRSAAGKVGGKASGESRRAKQSLSKTKQSFDDETKQSLSKTKQNEARREEKRTTDRRGDTLDEYEFPPLDAAGGVA